MSSSPFRNWHDTFRLDDDGHPASTRANERLESIAEYRDARKASASAASTILRELPKEVNDLIAEAENRSFVLADYERVEYFNTGYEMGMESKVLSEITDDRPLNTAQERLTVVAVLAELSCKVARTRREHEPAESAAVPATVLVVDDQELMRRGLRRSLERHGYRVLVASNPEQAKQLLQSHGGTVEVVLSDLEMPKPVGIEFLRFVQEQYPNTKRILMSGARKADGRAEAGLLHHFLAKPFSPSELVDALEGLL